MKTHFAFLFLSLGLSAAALGEESPSGRFVDAGVTLLLRDAARFFGSPKEFIDKKEAGDFLAAAIPEATGYADAKKKIAEMIGRFERSKRMTVSVSFSENVILVRFVRIFWPGAPADRDLIFVIPFDSHKRRVKDSLWPSSGVSGHEGPAPKADEIEPEQKPNQTLEPTAAAGRGSS